MNRERKQSQGGKVQKDKENPQNVQCLAKLGKGMDFEQKLIMINEIKLKG